MRNVLRRKPGILKGGKPVTNKELKQLRFLERCIPTLEGKEREAACRERDRLSEFIQAIPDEVTRGIFHLRYLKGWTWNRIALRYGWRDESGPRKIVERYFKNLSVLSDFPAVK